MTKERLELGQLGEEMAFKEVKRLGYKEVERNFRCPVGEVDLIAKDGDTLVFLEIKTRKNRSLGYAKEAVTERKKRQISKVALTYMKDRRCLGVKARFDVVAVSLGENKPEFEIIKNAFELAY